MDLQGRSRRSLGTGCSLAGTSAPACAARSGDPPRIWRRSSGCTGHAPSAPPTSSRTTQVPPRTSPRSRSWPRSARSTASIASGRSGRGCTASSSIERSTGPARAGSAGKWSCRNRSLPPNRGGKAERRSRALARLSPEHRAVIVMRYLLEFTPGEIAEALDLPRGTVNSRLRRGLDALGDEL